MEINKTDLQFSKAIDICREMFVAKLADYGPSWRIMRSQSLTDQIFIKAKRIRSLQTKGQAAIDEGILPEFIGIVNYGIIGIIQLEHGCSDDKDISNERAAELYDEVAARALSLMKAKNHDYDEAWRSMRVSSYDDFILVKIQRIKEIENNQGRTSVSEGIDANYLDIINYAVFGIIKLSLDNDEA